VDLALRQVLAIVEKQRVSALATQMRPTGDARERNDMAMRAAFARRVEESNLAVQALRQGTCDPVARVQIDGHDTIEQQWQADPNSSRGVTWDGVTSPTEQQERNDPMAE
jgi:hypothetical protein